MESGRIADHTKILLISQNPKETDNLLKLLKEKSQLEMLAIKHETARTYQVILDNKFATELKGREQFEARLALYGKPETIEDEVQRSRVRYEFERLTRPARLIKYLPNLSKKRQRVKKRVERIQSLSKKINEKKEFLSEAEESKLYSLLDFFESDLQSYRQAKDSYFKLMENLISSFAGFCAFIMVNDLTYSFGIAAITALGVFLLAKLISANYNNESIAIERSLENFKEKRRRRGKSHKSRRPRR